jgi:hypothetical protein
MSYSFSASLRKEADHRNGGTWIMRPTLILGLAAAVALAATIGASAEAQPTPPAPVIAVTASGMTVTAQGSTHVNNQFPWYVMDNSTKTKVKKLPDFTFTVGTAASPTTATVSVAPPAAGTLRGGYCQDTGCFTFTASCTATSCSITGT